MNYKILLVIVLTGLVVLFIVQNVAVVEISFLVWSVQIPRSILIFIMLAIGFIVGWFLKGVFLNNKD